MSNIFIPQLKPLADSVVQPDSPWMGTTEAELAGQTTSLWHQGTKDFRAWVWPSVGNYKGPSATVVQVAGQEGTFELGDSNDGDVQLRLPWHYHERATRITARLVVAFDVQQPLAVQIRTQELDDAGTADASGDYSGLLSRLRPSPPLAGPWSSGATRFGYNSFAKADCEVVPALAAGSLLAVTVYLKYDSEVDFDSFTTVAAYLYSVSLRNVLEEP
jgi:hypothetical protein